MSFHIDFQVGWRWETKVSYCGIQCEEKNRYRAVRCVIDEGMGSLTNIIRMQSEITHAVMVTEGKGKG